ncbi:virulence protein RhuM/Fic/DOC family protein [Hungatella sp. L12]|uniref:Virulence protein RhuM/Fic/DOC family protein n=2 Tax=Hungatella TaxID=1649459 RepID=A0ABR7H2L7_9FIRM|nr:virulence protein RhuM/Fic/DOC family protein [Hungatella hominis]MBC5707396.1 virulence protein RhuM/Fic/DOC family protein [Hungatella hominis]
MLKEETKGLVLYQTEDGAVTLEVNVEEDTVWLTQMQMADLFQRDISVISRHIKNVFQEEVEEKSNLHFLQIASSDKPVACYSLDVIISVGYRVKSKRGVEFRRWANQVLKDYIIRGCAVNQGRMDQLGGIIRIMKRVDECLDTRQVLHVIESYASALDLLDDYDHQRIQKPEGSGTVYHLTYEECRQMISAMHFSGESSLFGNEKDESFRSSIGAIYQTFGGKEVYASSEEKAANLLYFITKNHSFSDGNKRIAAAVFLYFLDKNGILFDDGNKRIDDYALAAITIMIAESRPEEKELMVNLVMKCLV